MVKFSNTVSFDAQYESQQRTVPVSMKPAIGKELFARQDLVEATGGMFKSNFATERFIHNDVRKYLLRSSTHWQSVHSEMSNLNTACLNAPNDDGSIYSPLPEAVSYRVLAEKVSNDRSLHLDVPIPAGIRANVVAKLLRDAGVEVTVDYRADCTSSSNTRTSDRSQFGNKVDHVPSRNLHKDFSNSRLDNWQPDNESMNSRHELSSFFPAIVDLSNAFGAIIHEESTSGYVRAVQDNSGLCLKAGTEVPKRVLADAREASLYSSVDRVYLSTEGGFGTAPIWYQQSMATGPPPHGILAEFIAV